jgi:hypothetical protein
VNCSETSLNQPALGPKELAIYRVAGFVRLHLQRILKQGLKKSTNILANPVFRGSGLENFHCILVFYSIFFVTSCGFIMPPFEEKGHVALHPSIGR